jgi:hypothetical protein
MVELINTVSVQQAKDLEIFAKQAGFNNSAEMIARFIKRELAIYYDIDENNEILSNIK